jgi:hypothetical protein
VTFGSQRLHFSGHRFGWPGDVISYEAVYRVRNEQLMCLTFCVKD